jgi:cholesterol oxidase
MKPIASPVTDIKPQYDLVVVGSGYGGAIAASRMARAGLRVCLLERGREFLSGEFPDTLPEVAEQIQMRLPGKHLGDQTALFDIHLQKQQNVVVGCGLGGTSLINANVSLSPADDVLNDQAWPEAIRMDEAGLLKEGFRRAREMLQPQPYPHNAPVLHKLEAHRQSAFQLGAPFSRPALNVTFETPPGGLNHVGVVRQSCIYCGDCVTGCNYDAKNTTRANYLPDAWNHGAEIFCQLGVRYLQQQGAGWRVYYQRLDAGQDRFDAPPQFVDARLVILAAGTLGSNEILLRSREQGLSLSGRLGYGFSGNGDMLGFGYNNDQAINGVGFGERKAQDMTPVGPCITGLIDLRDQLDRNQRMVIEEGTLPGAIASLLPEALAAAANKLGEDTDAGFPDWLHETRRIWTSALQGSYRGAVNHTQTYLVMSHDDAAGRIILEDDRIVLDWPGVGQQQNFRNAHHKLTQATAALGGTYVENPLWSDLFNTRLVTVHPLGGCCMGRDGTQGVVNHKGQVFIGAGEEVHSGLYVSDGSVLPTSLAVNPLLTISALTERCCALIARDYGWSIDYSLPSAPTRPHPVQPLGIRFTERMAGYFAATQDNGDALQSYRDAASLGREAGDTMQFTLTVSAADLNRFLDEPEHRGEITGTLECQVLSEHPIIVQQGEFRCFERSASPPDTRRMCYRIKLRTAEGGVLYFDAFKMIKDDPWQLDLWHDTTTLYVALYRGEDPSGERLGKGVLNIRANDFLRQLTTLQVTHAEDWLARLRATARFGRFFAGTLYECYGGIFYDPQPGSPSVPRKKRPIRAPAPEIHQFKTEDGVTLRLTRYLGGGKGPVMLVHGLGVSSAIFSTDLIDINLVEYLVAHEYDVWLLDYRVSILLPSSSDQSNGDQVARYDYPAAIAKIIAISGADTIQAVVHCYGATTFFMSMLSGLERVRSIVCSQIATDILVPAVTAVKSGLHIPSFLEKLGIDSLTARVPADGGSLLTQLYDEALDLNAMVQAQGRCSSDTCHRITFLYGSLYRHDRLSDRLHSHLHELFGEANIETLEHLATICRAGELVDAAGNDTYLPHLERLDLPILFISGADNECYLPESTRLSYERLCQAYHPHQYQRVVIPGYGHIDCIFGERADRDVYPLIVNHLDRTLPNATSDRE